MLIMSTKRRRYSFSLLQLNYNYIYYVFDDTRIKESSSNCTQTVNILHNDPPARGKLEYVDVHAYYTLLKVQRQLLNR